MELDFDIIFGMDKQKHFINYTLLTICFSLFVMFISDFDSIKRRFSYLWIGLVTIGVLEEYRQFMIPNRSAEFLDAVANILGVTVGIVVPVAILYIVKYRNHYLVRLFFVYFIILISMVVGLIYVNEVPFMTWDEPTQEKMRSLIALIGL